MNPSHADHTPPESPTSEAADNPDADAPSQPNGFPFTVGTWVAVEFDDGAYTGTIVELYEDEQLCRVEFTDGDSADYDADEIHYAVQLYQRDFAH